MVLILGDVFRTDWVRSQVIEITIDIFVIDHFLFDLRGNTDGGSGGVVHHVKQTVILIILLFLLQ